MDVVGFVILLTVLGVQSINLCIDKTIPYFPIEISRTAVGPYASQFFLLMVCVLGIATYAQHGLVSRYFSAWLGIFVVATYDDVNYYTIHMLGAYHIFLTAASLAFINYKNQDFWILLSVITLLYVLKLAFKATPVWFIETSDRETLVPLSDDLANIVQSCKKISYGTYDGELSHVTKILFKLSAVFQWVIFWMIYQLFKL